MTAPSMEALAEVCGLGSFGLDQTGQAAPDGWSAERAVKLALLGMVDLPEGYDEAEPPELICHRRGDLQGRRGVEVELRGELRDEETAGRRARCGYAVVVNTVARRARVELHDGPAAHDPVLMAWAGQVEEVVDGALADPASQLSQRLGRLVVEAARKEAAEALEVARNYARQAARRMLEGVAAQWRLTGRGQAAGALAVLGEQWQGSAEELVAAAQRLAEEQAAAQAGEVGP